MRTGGEERRGRVWSGYAEPRIAGVTSASRSASGFCSSGGRNIRRVAGAAVLLTLGAVRRGDRRALMPAPHATRRTPRSSAMPATSPCGTGKFAEPVAEGSASMLTVRLEQVTTGDLDGNGSADIAAVLVTHPGGSGRIFHAARTGRERGPAAPRRQRAARRPQSRTLWCESMGRLSRFSCSTGSTPRPSARHPMCRGQRPLRGAPRRAGGGGLAVGRTWHAGTCLSERICRAGCQPHCQPFPVLPAVFRPVRTR